MIDNINYLNNKQRLLEMCTCIVLLILGGLFLYYTYLNFQSDNLQVILAVAAIMIGCGMLYLAIIVYGDAEELLA